MFQLTSKSAVITGGASGIGEAISILFGQQGAQVAVLDVDEAAARRVADRIVAAGGKADAHRCDVSSAADTVAAMSAVEKSAGRIDILANIAGVAHVGTVETTTEADFDRVYRVNVKGMFLSTQAALPVILKGGGGVILNMASIASLIGIPERFAYIGRAGPVLSVNITRHLEAQATALFVVASPDSIGLDGAEFSQLGLRYRWATGEERPAFP